MDTRMDDRPISSSAIHVKTHGLQCALLTLRAPPIFFRKSSLNFTLPHDNFSVSKQSVGEGILGWRTSFIVKHSAIDPSQMHRKRKFNSPLGRRKLTTCSAPVNFFFRFDHVFVRVWWDQLFTIYNLLL